MSQRLFVYVAHPLNAPSRAGIEENLHRGARWCAWLATYFSIVPLAPWIYLAAHWDETAGNRARGLAIDCATIERCDELWLVGPRVSEGMLLEARHAVSCGKVVRNLTRIDMEDLGSTEGKARLSFALAVSWVPPTEAGVG